MPKKLTQEEAINRLKEKHPEYDFSKAAYTGSNKKIEAVCPLHGSFWSRFADLVTSTRCPKCSVKSIKDKQKTSIEDFIAKANEIHNNFYKYSKVDYVNNRTKVTITCPIHGDFQQRPEHHITGHGCKKCTMKGNSWTLESWKTKASRSKNFLGFTLYLLHCFDKKTGEEFLKIGRTFTSLNERYRSKTCIPYDYTVIATLTTNPDVIVTCEKAVKKKHKEHTYIPSNYFPGISECFDLSALNSIKSYFDLEL